MPGVIYTDGLGFGGGGGTVFVAKYADITTADITTLYGAAFAPDGTNVVNGDLVLFTGTTALTGLGGRGVYRAIVAAGVLVGWVKVVFGQSPAGDSVDGDEVVIAAGTVYADHHFQCTDTTLATWINWMPDDLAVKDEGALIDSDVVEINFAGAGVDATTAGAGKALVTVSGLAVRYKLEFNATTDWTSDETFGQFSGSPIVGGIAGTPIVIDADFAGVVGNITLTGDGAKDVDTLISDWNIANPANTVTLASGDGTQVPDNLTTLDLIGGVDGTEYSIPIPQATHLKGLLPQVTVQELNGASYENLFVDVRAVTTTGDVDIVVTQVPDGRFEGRVIIS